MNLRAILSVDDFVAAYSDRSVSDIRDALQAGVHLLQIKTRKMR